jgi:hypothetical protein
MQSVEYRTMQQYNIIVLLTYAEKLANILCSLLDMRSILFTPAISSDDEEFQSKKDISLVIICETVDKLTCRGESCAQYQTHLPRLV